MPWSKFWWMELETVLRQESVPRALIYSRRARWMVRREFGTSRPRCHGDEAAEGGAEIAGGKVFAREEIGEVMGEFIGGAGLGVFAGVVGAEVGMMGGAGSTAAAAVGKGETTQGRAVLRAKRTWVFSLS